MNEKGTSDVAPVLLTVQGTVGRITLNRPRAINALTHEMVHIMADALQRWRTDPDISVVVLDGAGERGLCAGGDIRAIYLDAASGGNASIAFWRDEYQLNAAIAEFPKPFVALMDGLVMGGGIGLSSHASHRVVTERSILAMPEVGIGFAPDVGGTYLLARSPGRSGLHAALTGARMNAADAIHMQLADVLVPVSDHERLVELISEVGADSAVAALSAQPDAGAIEQQRHWIDACYAGDSIGDIIDNLRSSADAEAHEAGAAIGSAAPTAVKVTLRAVRSAASMTLREALNQEFRMVSAALRSADLVEGIRAQVIDKGRSPRWSPETVDGVSDDVVDRYFAAVADPPFPTVVDGRIPKHALVGGDV